MNNYLELKKKAADWEEKSIAVITPSEFSMEMYLVLWGMAIIINTCLEILYQISSQKK